MKFDLKKLFVSWKRVCAAGVAGVALSAATANATILTNGGFELPGGAAQVYAGNPVTELGQAAYVAPSYGDVTPTGWTRSGSRLWYMTDLDPTTQLDTGTFPGASDYAMRLDAANTGGGGASAEVLSQSGLNLIAGQQYQLDFDFWSESMGGGTIIRVNLSGPSAILLGDQTDGAGVTSPSLNFTPTVTGSYTLEFSAPDISQPANHVWLDNVSLTAVPEPASLGLVCLGGVMMALRRRRQFS